MKQNKTIFDYFTQVLIIFGFTILTLNIFCILFGEDAKAFSTLFTLGNQGLGIATMLQFFLISVVITALRFVFFTDVLIKKMSVALRTICMFTLIIIVMIICIFQFDWFPANQPRPWIMFLLCFGISALVSTILATAKENMENKQMAEALEKLKQEQSNMSSQ